MPEIQAIDLGHRTGTNTPYTNAQVAALLNVAFSILGAQYVFLSRTDDTFNNCWNSNPGAVGAYGTQAYGSTGIAGAIAAAYPSGIPSANRAYPYSSPP